MAVQLPQKSDSSATRPKAVTAHGNGKLPSSILQPCGIRSFVMADPAARAMRAMVAAAARDGVTISATGTYRTYERQLSMFQERYVTWNTGQSSKTWNGKRYWLRPGNAMSATPGTSNHGWGVAADLSESPTKSLTETSLRWLAANGPSFGYWNTVSSEAWHWSYCLGDAVPSKVKEIEKSHGIKPPPKIDWKSVEQVEKALKKLDYPGLLKKGSVGFAVSAVQWKLNASGHDLVIDGDFGSKTVAAVRAFQKANDLEVDGIVGQVTWGALDIGSAGTSPEAPSPRKRRRKKGRKKKPTTSTAATTTPADGEAVYTVQAGDGLLRVARYTLWSRRMSDAKAIAKANDLTIDAAITPGDELQIPDCRSTDVVRGDGWLAVSKRLGRTADEVLERNAWQGDILHPGMTIYGGKQD